MESQTGIEALNAKLLPTLAQSDDAFPQSYGSPFEAQDVPSRSMSRSPNQFGGADAGRLDKPLPKRSSTMSNFQTMSNGRSSLAAPSASKKRSSVGGPTPSGRLNKVIADLYLLSGRTSDAVQWWGLCRPIPPTVLIYGC